jgi:hypothetical protein
MLHLLELLQMLRLLLGPARLLPQLSPEPLGLSIPKEHRSTRARLTVPLSPRALHRKVAEACCRCSLAALGDYDARPADLFARTTPWAARALALRR